MEFKIIADTLASMASFVAIVVVMVGWYRNSRKPLKITRVVIHKETDKIKFIIVVKNVKDHPVMIKRTDCYKTKKFEVQKKVGGKPEYKGFYSSSEMLFCNNETFEIPANAHTDIIIEVNAKIAIPPKLCFLFETSHGYHELLCKDITIADIGKVDVFGLEYRLNYESKHRAKAVYYWKFLKELSSRTR